MVDAIYITKADFVLRPYPTVLPIMEEEIVSLVDYKEFKEITVGWTKFKNPKDLIVISLTEVEDKYHGEVLTNVGDNVWEYKGCYYQTEKLCGMYRIAWRFLPGDVLIKCQDCGKLFVPKNNFIKLCPTNLLCDSCASRDELKVMLYKGKLKEEEDKDKTKTSEQDDIFDRFFNGNL